jgi:uncharacterized protein YbcI
MDNPTAPSTARGEVGGRLASAVVRWYRDRFGRGPTRAKAYVHDEFAVVVLGDVQTQVERSLVAGGEVDSVELLRRRIRQMFADEIKAIVEEVVGAQVSAMLGDHNAAANTTVIAFLLERSSPQEVSGPEPGEPASVPTSGGLASP